uniref:MFS transporter n=1 Tax=Thermosporothrix sp. COM3 TaxID=2490863 RepID=A0A455SLK1_9CHLR|nr:MFS transporter [Thermosporothrix sp. COM3]
MIFWNIPAFLRTIQSQRHMFPVICACSLGTALVWYDFFLYAFFSATIFPRLFFPTLDPYSAIIAAFTTNFVGFVARPIGGAFFSIFGDRIGRKSTLVMTLLLIGFSSMLIGVLPDYQRIGLLAPIGLGLLRFLQGIGLGGEWSGSVLLSLEHGDEKHRAFWGSWAQVGVPIGLLLSTISAIVFRHLYPDEAFTAIGWRVPFLLSTILLTIGLYIRLRIPETPPFVQLLASKQIASSPLLEVVRRYWRPILLCTLLRSGENAPFYIFTTFTFTYLGQTSSLSPEQIYFFLAIASLVALITIPLFALLSDHVGRRRWYALGSLLMAVFAFPYFLLLQSLNPWLIVTAFVLSLGLCIAWLYGPQAALIVSCFETRLRYSGATLGYQLASLTAGGPTPILATSLIAGSQSTDSTFFTSIALFIVIMSIISFLSALLLRQA